MIGAISCGRRKVCRTERMPSARTTRRFVASALTPRPASCSAFSSLSSSRW